MASADGHNQQTAGRSPASTASKSSVREREPLAQLHPAEDGAEHAPLQVDVRIVG